MLPGQWYSKPFASFHQINAFEDHGCVVLDLCCQDDGTTLSTYKLQNLRRSGEGLDQVRPLHLCCIGSGGAPCWFSYFSEVRDKLIGWRTLCLGDHRMKDVNWGKKTTSKN